MKNETSFILSLIFFFIYKRASLIFLLKCRVGPGIGTGMLAHHDTTGVSLPQHCPFFWGRVVWGRPSQWAEKAQGQGFLVLGCAGLPNLHP